MGNKHGKSNNQPLKQRSKSAEEKVTPISSKSVNDLNDTYLNYLEVDIALECAKRFQIIHNPFIIIVSFKQNNNIFDTKDDDNEILDQILKPANHSIMTNTKHKDVKIELTNITKQKIIGKPFDGLVFIFLCVVRLQDDQINDERDLKYYYDSSNERRHIDKLRKDVVYRLDETQSNVYFHYYYTTITDIVDNNKPRPGNKNASRYAKEIPEIRVQKEEAKKQRKIARKKKKIKCLVHGYCGLFGRQCNNTIPLEAVNY
eukprot:796561_1